MLDLAWTEIALIAVVALVVIGPKDLPEAVRGVAKGVQKLRRMAAEFQSHADELVREAKLDEVRNQINEIRNFDLKGEIERAVDKDGSIRKTFEEDPLKDPAPTYTPPPSSAASPATSADKAAPAATAGGDAAERREAPAFIPPDVAAATAQQGPPAAPPPSPSAEASVAPAAEAAPAAEPPPQPPSDEAPKPAPQPQPSPPSGGGTAA